MSILKHPLLCRRPMAKLIIDKETCTGCEACIPKLSFRRPVHAGGESGRGREMHLLRACVEVCPVSAITLERDEKTGGVDASAYKDVWIFIEHERGKVSSVSFELPRPGEKTGG